MNGKKRKQDTPILSYKTNLFYTKLKYLHISLFITMDAGRQSYITKTCNVSAMNPDKNKF
jgi:hypothetical protein